MALPVEDNKNDAAASQAIKGNLPPKVKHMLDSVLHELMARPNVFGAAIGERIVITEASTVQGEAEDPPTHAFRFQRCRCRGAASQSRAPVTVLGMES
jgi:hypothetical protein